MGRKPLEPEDLKIDVKLKLKRNLRESARNNKINLSQLLEEALIKRLNEIHKEKKRNFKNKG